MLNKIIGPIAPPRAKDVFDHYADQTRLSINCVQIGQIESYDKLTRTASVSIKFQKKLIDGNVYDYPVLTDCPVFILKGGPGFIEFPIVAGDSCLVLFNDRDIDNWFRTGQTLVPNSSRSHSLSDGIVLVGVCPLTDIATELEGKTSFNGGTGPAQIKGTGVNIEATLASLVTVKNATQNLKTILSSLIDQIAAITVTPASLAVPTPIPNNSAAILAIKTQLALLLG
jgi:hypothetical protein